MRWSGGAIALVTLVVGCGGGSGSSGGVASAVAAATSATAATPTSASPATPTSSSAPTPPPPPAVATAVTPARAANDRDRARVVAGSGLASVARASLDGPALVDLTITGRAADRLDVVVPAGAAPGSYALVLVDSAGRRTTGPAVEVGNALDPDRPGAYAAGHLDERMTGADGDQVEVRLYYPATTAGAGAPADPSDGPYPVVVLCHGFKPPLISFGISFRGYGWLGEALASYGYVVIAPDLATNTRYLGSNGTGQRNAERDADDALAALDHLAAVAGDATHPLFGLPDAGRGALVGHSRGGDAALIAGADEALLRGAAARVKALVAMGAPAFDSRNGGAPLAFGAFSALPLLLVVGTNDGIAPLADQRAIFAQAGASSALLELVGGNHSLFKDSDARIWGDRAASISGDEQRATTARYVVAWLGWALRGDRRVTPGLVLGGAAMRADARVGVLDVR